MFAIVPAAGIGSRMGESNRNTSKVFLPIADGVSVLRRTVQSVVASGVCRGIVVLTRAGDEPLVEALLADEAPELERAVSAGGDTRQESVAIGLERVGDKAEFVLVHDGARPFCPVEKIREVAAAARDGGAAILALPVKPSLKEVDASQLIRRTIPRENIWEAQTPQVFLTEILRRAHAAARREGFVGTDESELVEKLGTPVRVVRGDERNLKITTPFDITIAEILARD